MDLDNAQISITPPVRCFNNLTVDGNMSALNIYTKTETNNLLNLKVNTSELFVLQKLK